MALEKIEKILQPKRSGLNGKTKPVVLIVSSPYDAHNSSTSLKSAVKYLKELGYTVLNTKNKCYWNDMEFQDSIKSVDQRTKEITLWIQAHGAPGWFFGAENSARSEAVGVEDFHIFQQRLLNRIGSNIKIKSVVLSGCFTAVEIMHKDADKNYHYNYSPARMLSIALPDAQVLGFIGQFAEASVTNVFKKRGVPPALDPVAVKPEEASVLYKQGLVVESYTTELYCNHSYTPRFLEKELGLGRTTADDYFLPCDAHSRIQRLGIEESGYALKQKVGLRLYQRLCNDVPETKETAETTIAEATIVDSDIIETADRKVGIDEVETVDMMVGVGEVETVDMMVGVGEVETAGMKVGIDEVETVDMMLGIGEVETVDMKVEMSPVGPAVINEDIVLSANDDVAQPTHIENASTDETDDETHSTTFGFSS